MGIKKDLIGFVVDWWRAGQLLGSEELLPAWPSLTKTRLGYIGLDCLGGGRAGQQGNTSLGFHLLQELLA